MSAADAAADAASECGQPFLAQTDAPADRRPATVSVFWVVLALLAVQASFGGNAVIIKVALGKSADPVVFSFLRDVGGAAVLLLACRVFGCLVLPRREDAGIFVLLGILGVYIGQMFLVMALQYVQPIHAAVILRTELKY